MAAKISALKVPQSSGQKRVDPPAHESMHHPTRQGEFTTWVAFGLAMLGALAMLGGVARPAHAATDIAELPSERARLASASLLLDLAAAGNRLVAVGDRGHILLSDDAGRTWTQTDVPTQVLLTGICFGDQRHGIAVGHDEIILISSDAGSTWQRTHFAPQAQQPLLDVWCGDRGRAIAVGAYGVYMVSSDYGASWEGRKLEVTRATATPPDKAADSTAAEGEISGGYHLNAITADSSSHLYIAAEAGHLFRSDDAGNTWKALPSPYEGSLFGVLPLPAGALLAYGLRGNLFRSADSGATWKRIPTGTEAMLTGAISFADGRIAIVGLSGVVLLSHDEGASFSLLQRADRKGLAAVREVQNGALVTVGEAGVKLIEAPRP
jgi:photosystem II stability/assembly factor-like uncharacterized protein